MARSDRKSNRDATRIVRLPIKAIRPADYNPRKATPEKLEALRESIRRFGFVDPVIVNVRVRRGHPSYVCIGGHQRLKVAEELGYKDAPCIVRQHSPEDEKILNLALNNPTGEFDLLPAADLLRALLKMESDLKATGFSDKEIEKILAEADYIGRSAPQEGDDDLPEKVPTKTKPGDLVLLGPHRLLCGDCSKPEDVRRLMDGKRAVLLATDPPYQVGYDRVAQRSMKSERPFRAVASGKQSRRPKKGKGEAREIVGDERSDDPELFERFLRVAFEEALIENPAVYQWYADKRIEAVLAAWRSHDLLPHQTIVWAKNQGAFSVGRYHFLQKHEPCQYGWRKGKVPSRRPPGDASTIWENDRISGGSKHPTQKPVDLWIRPINYHTAPGDIVFDPFCGSGTALIAAARTGRVCYAMEIDPAFCDVIRARFALFETRQDDAPA